MRTYEPDEAAYACRYSSARPGWQHQYYSPAQSRSTGAQQGIGNIAPIRRKLLFILYDEFKSHYYTMNSNHTHSQLQTVCGVSASGRGMGQNTVNVRDVAGGRL